MNVLVMRHCSRCMSLQNVDGTRIMRSLSILSNPMSTGRKSEAVKRLGTFSTQVRQYASKDVKKKPVRQHLPLNQKYLNYLYVATSRYRWIEFPKGITFDVGLYDSFEEKEYNEKVPVIVGIPGCVGTHEDLVQYLSTFVNLGYRVIIPNLPGSKYCKGRTKTEEHAFTMSANEKAEFIKDTLETIKVPQVDMLVVHSDGIFTGLELVAGQIFKLKNVKSLTLIDPVGLNYTKAMSPIWIYKTLSKLIESYSHITSVKRLLINIFKIFSEKRRWKANDVMLYARNIGAISFEDARLNAQRFKHSPLPLRVFYSDVGSAIDIPSTEELLEVIGVDKSQTTTCDEEMCQIISKGTLQDNQHCFFFTNGQTTESKLIFIRTELLKFLKCVRPDIMEL